MYFSRDGVTENCWFGCVCKMDMCIINKDM